MEGKFKIFFLDLTTHLGTFAMSKTQITLSEAKIYI